MITVEAHQRVTIVRLDHGRVNALDLELLTAITSTMTGLPAERAVVLTGVGTVFSAGVDLRRIVDGGPDYVQEFLPALDTALLALFDHPGPVIAAVNGHAIAGGCVLAAGCDLRLMSTGTIGLTELLVGVPFPTIPLEIMRHAAGPALTALALRAQPITADEARRIGFVDAVTAPDLLLTEALDAADAMARMPPAAFALTKRQLHEPARARIDAIRTRDDPFVADRWRSQAALAGITSYLDHLAHRTGR